MRMILSTMTTRTTETFRRRIIRWAKRRDIYDEKKMSMSRRKKVEIPVKKR